MCEMMILDDTLCTGESTAQISCSRTILSRSVELSLSKNEKEGHLKKMLA
jgi:hypothetical protein